jgi:hypothetical protein
VAIVVALQVPVVTVPKVTRLELPVYDASNLSVFKLMKLLSISAFVRGRFFLVTPPVPVVPVSLVVIEAIYCCSYGFYNLFII